VISLGALKVLKSDFKLLEPLLDVLYLLIKRIYQFFAEKNFGFGGTMSWVGKR
jgi:hypothetical protein